MHSVDHALLEENCLQYHSSSLSAIAFSKFCYEQETAHTGITK